MEEDAGSCAGNGAGIVGDDDAEAVVFAGGTHFLGGMPVGMRDEGAIDDAVVILRVGIIDRFDAGMSTNVREGDAVGVSCRSRMQR